MVTIHDKGSDNIRLRSGSCHMMTKKTLIWVPMCKEKRMKNSGESDFRHNRRVARLPMIFLLIYFPSGSKSATLLFLMLT